MYFISSKPYKAWCRARGIPFRVYIHQFPFAEFKLGLAHTPIKIHAPRPLKVVAKEPTRIHKALTMLGRFFKR